MFIYDNFTAVSPPTKMLHLLGSSTGKGKRNWERNWGCDEDVSLCCAAERCYFQEQSIRQVCYPRESPQVMCHRQTAVRPCVSAHHRNSTRFVPSLIILLVRVLLTAAASQWLFIYIFTHPEIFDRVAWRFAMEILLWCLNALLFRGYWSYFFLSQKERFRRGQIFAADGYAGSNEDGDGGGGEGAAQREREALALPFGTIFASFFSCKSWNFEEESAVVTSNLKLLARLKCSVFWNFGISSLLSNRLSSLSSPLPLSLNTRPASLSSSSLDSVDELMYKRSCSVAL